MNIVLGITGSIAAYKAADLVRHLKREDYEVFVVMTKNATTFITPLTLQVLSKNIVHLDTTVEPDVRKINHIELALLADLFVIAPASANIIGKIASGIADDLLSTIAMAMPKKTKKIIAPAMNTRMYENPIQQKNLQTLKKILHYTEVPPKNALLACGEKGCGVLASINDILEKIKEN
ncbi:MAG: phosphopantothenoylcysteine decarboxylase [Streptococcaceae bacterium]|jgi:phosphopantothenoylcysteine decarboxylase|nr:phosphopantothenoylcysteine decarboxylase [Streptococcaceae bacterium]